MKIKKLKGQIADPTGCATQSQNCSSSFQSCSFLSSTQGCSSQGCLLQSTQGCSNCQSGCAPATQGSAVAIASLLFKDTGRYSKSKNFFIGKIEAYQKLVDPQMKKRLGVKKICKFNPTCSQYAKQAIKKHGNAKGILLSAWRIARCNPFSRGGDDPVK